MNRKIVSVAISALLVIALFPSGALATFATAAASTKDDIESSVSAVRLEPLTDGSTISLIPYSKQKFRVDVTDASHKDKANVQAWKSNSTSAQKFLVKRVGKSTFSLQNLNSGKYLTADEKNVYQRSASSKGLLNSQKWIATKTSGGFTLTNLKTSKNMMILKNGISYNIGVAKKSNSKAQVFKKQEVSVLESGIFTITNSSDLAIQIAGGSVKSGAEAQVFRQLASAGQKWKLKQEISGYFTISCVRSGKLLTASNSHKANGVKVKLWHNINSNRQKWEGVVAGGGWVYLKAANGMYLSTSGVKAKSGSNLTITMNVKRAVKLRMNYTTYDPGSVLLNVAAISQRPQLPTGCEITAVAIMLNGYGVPANKVKLAREMPYSGNPNAGYVGNPFTYGGWTIYPPALMGLVKRYAGSATLLTGSSAETLKDHLLLGKPVVVWTTMHGFGVHAICLVGYDSNGFYYNDPWTGKKNVHMSYKSFNRTWSSQAKRAITC